MNRGRLLLLILFFLITVPGISAASYTSAQYTLSAAGIESSGGPAQSLSFSLRNARIGSFFSGKAQSANFSIDTQPLEYGVVPHPPVLNPLITPTNVTTQTLTGSKDEDTGIYINGFAVVPLNHETTWQYEQALEEGENTLVITARSQAGLASKAVYAIITLDTTAPAPASVAPAPVVTQIAETSVSAQPGGGGQSPPQINGLYPSGGSTRFTNQGPVTFLTSAGDGGGDSLLYQYTVDGTVKSAWGGSPEFVWAIAGETPGVHIIKVEVRNNSGGISGQEIKFCLFCPPLLPD
ncbi:MAG: hypothetical protein V1662_01900 [Candidatus Omnitrophota bacterium]